MSGKRLTHPANTYKNPSKTNMIEDSRSDFDKGFHEGVLCAYREISMWSQARLDRLEPGKSQRMRDDIEHAHGTLLRLLRHHLPPKHYPEVWK